MLKVSYKRADDEVVIEDKPVISSSKFRDR